MAVRLRLRRMGRKKRPFYRIVAADSRAPRDGRFIELVGTYDPLVQPHKIDIQEDRIFYWLKNGAQPSRTVRNLFQSKGVMLKWDLMQQGADEAKIAEEYAKWEALQVQRAQRLEEEKAKKAKTKTVEKEAAVEEEEKAGTKTKAVEKEAAVKEEEKPEAKAEEKPAEADKDIPTEEVSEDQEAKGE